MNENVFKEGTLSPVYSQPQEKKSNIFSLSFSFIFMVILFIELVVIMFVFSAKYNSIKDYLIKSEDNFMQRGKELTLLTSNSAGVYFKENKINELSSIFSDLSGKAFTGSVEKSINEIFILDKQGRVLAHSDVTMVTSKAKKRVNEIAMKYNNEFFHSALLLKEGQIYIQDYPYPTTSIMDNYSYMLKFFLSKNLNYTVDFAAPVVIKGKNVATAHVQMNRVFMYEFFKDEFTKLVSDLIIVFIAALLLSMLLIFGFYLYIRKLRNIWIEFLSVLREKKKIKGDPAEIEKTIYNQMNYKKPKEADKFSNKEILDAILLE
ncbi:MAG: cell wall metabolism sensor histidine kinase WalK [Spirochaetia bacterium]|nr:cell wall metabolism sensor histidine kinase WalK [Spirochaetia bacterium]